jgi:hypothetical protein
MSISFNPGARFRRMNLVSQGSQRSIPDDSVEVGLAVKSGA